MPTDPQPIDRDTVVDSIRRHLADRHVDPDTVDEDATFETDLGLDSLSQLTLAQHVEDEFRIAIAPHEAADLTTVGKTVDFVLAHVPSAARN